jgi:hypothetical protein
MAWQIGIEFTLWPREKPPRSRKTFPTPFHSCVIGRGRLAVQGIGRIEQEICGGLPFVLRRLNSKKTPGTISVSLLVRQARELTRRIVGIVGRCAVVIDDFGEEIERGGGSTFQQTGEETALLQVTGAIR